MLAVESKSGIAKGNPETVFNYISDFRNFSGLLPGDRLNNLQITREKIIFDIQGLGTVGLEIQGKQPWSMLTVGPSKDSSTDFTFIIHIKEAGKDLSAVKLNLTANLNMFLEMMARNPLQQFVDLMIDKLSEVNFTPGTQGQV
jgi:carbon monoxide dehydrogenase subunit G